MSPGKKSTWGSSVVQVKSVPLCSCTRDMPARRPHVAERARDALVKLAQRKEN